MSERTMPIVSVIIPCYNQAHFLCEAMESALAQRNGAMEVVVVDDGSPDNIVEVAGRYPGIVFVRQENRGLAGARNSGFRASKGEYILFLDADDRLTPNAVQSHLLCFAEHPHAGFVVGQIDHISLDGSYLRSPRWPMLTGSSHYKELLRVNHVANTIAVMFRRSVIDEVGGFRLCCSPAEDYDLLLRAARCFASAHHDTVVAQYRRHPATLSRRGAVMLAAMDRVMDAQWQFVKEDKEPVKAWREGKRYWRDHFGVETIKEILTSLRQRKALSAARSTIGLAKYVRGRLFLFPLKYWRRVLRAVTGRAGVKEQR